MLIGKPRCGEKERTMDNLVSNESGDSSRGIEIFEEFKSLTNKNKINLSFSDVTCTVRKHLLTTKRKKILQNASGEFKAGDLIAIIGPSGSGKTTLMNILAGYITKGVTGEIKVNGETRDLNSFRRSSAYIMQDNNIHGQLTVLESMWVAAVLKLNGSSEVKMQRINLIIKLMGLQDVKMTYTQNLSGGQRKRLVIAFELISDSPVMFFDEPTSDLDSVTSRQCVEIMKSLALGGRTIISTIHQPSATLLNMFDHLYVLAKGECVYNGRVPDLLPHLESLGFKCPTYHNPSDFMLDVVNGEFGDHTTKLAESANIKYLQNNQTVSNDESNTEQPHKQSTKERKHYVSGFFKQFRILLWSNLIRIWRNRDLPMSIILSHLLMAIFIGWLYWQIGQNAARIRDNAKLIFYNIVFVSFCALSSTLQSFPQELPTLTREYFNSWYSAFSLYLAKKFTYVIVTTTCTITYVMIVYFMTDQLIEIKRIGLIVLHCFLIGLISQNIGIWFAAALSPKISLFLGIYSLMPHLVFSGLFVRSRDTLAVLGKIFDYSMYKHSFEGIMLATYGYCRPRLECPDICEFSTPKSILNEYDMQHADYWYSTRYLVGFYLVVDIITYFTVKWRLSR